MVIIRRAPTGNIGTLFVGTDGLVTEHRLARRFNTIEAAYQWLTDHLVHTSENRYEVIPC